MYKKIRKGIIKAERANLTILPLSIASHSTRHKTIDESAQLGRLAWRRTWMTADMCFTSSAITI
jgi:hypothetical protein